MSHLNIICGIGHTGIALCLVMVRSVVGKHLQEQYRTACTQVRNMSSTTAGAALRYKSEYCTAEVSAAWQVAVRAIAAVCWRGRDSTEVVPCPQKTHHRTVHDSKESPCPQKTHHREVHDLREVLALRRLTIAKYMTAGRSSPSEDSPSQST